MYGCPNCGDATKCPLGSSAAVIATSRIDSYDGEPVTFHYKRHESHAYIERTLPTLDFNQWRTLILLSFGYDPLKLSKLRTTTSVFL